MTLHIVTDSGSDLSISHEEARELDIHSVPLVVSLDGKSYREGIDIKPHEFYPLLEQSENLPTTSQPSAGDFAEVYRRLAKMGGEILSIHMTSGLSGTYHSALAGAQMVPEAAITHVDTKTLSAAAGWQVEAAARAARAGWPIDKILELLNRIGAASESVYTLRELKYLIHGGRISHMKGLIAQVLNMKPIIGVEKVRGTYVQRGSVRSFSKALMGLVDQVLDYLDEGSAIRVQVLHANNPDDAQELHRQIDKRFDCEWLPMGPMSLVLGAHTGWSMIGVAFAPRGVFADVPA
ncbi:MAG: DegV family protein [Anaerolineales bacterium]|nr:DegV family protein [Anaerolineales bacterium]